ncbi:hypothetical protein AA0488_0230 [Kozakia baliensis NRIC 0488]|nr:hypothetical protein AA0488_0230 [Kozakia baliensis NRIC 0488]GEL65595.1 hypothetical protein KBA01_28810 [Kozakia baliensis]
MSDRILIFYGSYRSDRQGIRLAEWLVRAYADRGMQAELIDAKVIDLPILDRMTRNIATARRPARWRRWQKRSKVPMPSYSSRANITGACSPD